MKFLSEMEWNAKWDWDNMVSFNSRANESLKMLQLTDWGIEDEGEIDAGYLSGIGGSSGGSGSDLGNGSSVKSSKSASTESSPKGGAKTSSFTDLSRTSSPFLPFGVYAEPVMGLRLGKRTYFENSSGSSIKSPSVTYAPMASVPAVKRPKSSSQNGPPPLCQVEGCNIDLSSAKDYHRKHRVCDAHSKCPKVVVKGVERRFCQQCSRFHSLSEFDAKKRSCRRRLADHNSRRRKPRQETIRFSSARHSAAYYDGRQNVNFSLSNVGDSRKSSWESVSDSKFTVTKLPAPVPEKVGQPPLPRFGLPYSLPFQGNSSKELFTSKSSATDVFKQGFKDSIFSSNMDTTPEYPRALSLLSTTSWGSSEPDSISFDQPLHANPAGVMHLSAIPLQYASSDYWPTEHLSSSSLMNSSNSGAQFTGIQFLKSQFHHNIY